MSELNEWEATNIYEAMKKHLTERKNITINVEWLKKVHKDMFDKTWTWAGTTRKSNLNIGVDSTIIQMELKKLVDDMLYWGGPHAIMSVLEQSIRIHHRLVKIHPFVNGNGRHARLVSDIFLFSRSHKLPNWPNNDLIKESNIRNKYIEALKDADKGSYGSLEDFTASLLDK